MTEHYYAHAILLDQMWHFPDIIWSSPQVNDSLQIRICPKDEVNLAACGSPDRKLHAARWRSEARWRTR